MFAVLYFPCGRPNCTHLREALQHQQDPQALHVNASVKQLHSFVQVVLSGQRDHQLGGRGGEGGEDRQSDEKSFRDLDG